MHIPARVILLSLLLSVSGFCVVAQTVTPKTVPEVAPADTVRRVSADETFELNIDERRFSQENFEASTAVSTDTNSQGLNLQIGVALAAGKIEVLLRNVRGNVRFRGTLDRVFEMMGNRRKLPAVPSP